jgi:hypothetical protein
MSERHPLGTEITQGLTAHQRIKRRRWVAHSLKYGALTWKQLIGLIARNSGSISQLVVCLAIGGLPPSQGHFGLGRRDSLAGAAIEQAAETKQVPDHTAGRMALCQQRSQARLGRLDLLASSLLSSSITTV